MTYAEALNAALAATARLFDFRILLSRQCGIALSGRLDIHPDDRAKLTDQQAHHLDRLVREHCTTTLLAAECWAQERRRSWPKVR